MIDGEDNEAKTPDLIDTIKTPDVPEDAAKAIDENGEPFKGNNA